MSLLRSGEARHRSLDLPHDQRRGATLRVALELESRERSAFEREQVAAEREQPPRWAAIENVDQPASFVADDARAVGAGVARAVRIGKRRRFSRGARGLERPARLVGGGARSALAQHRIERELVGDALRVRRLDLAIG